MLRLLPISRVLVGSQGLKRTKIKNEYAQRRRLRRINSLPKRRSFHDLSASTKPQKIKASLSKVQALKFILQIAASKLENCVFRIPIFKFYFLSPNLRSSFANLFNFKFSKPCWKSPKLYTWILAHFEKMSLARWFSAFFFFWKKRCFACKMGKNERFLPHVRWRL